MVKSEAGDVNRTRLVCPKTEAVQLVEKQLAEGKAIVNRTFKSKTELDEAENEMSVWSEYTAEVLRQIATNNRLAEDFTSSSFGFVGGFPESLLQQVEEFRSIYGRRIVKLEAILKRLDILPEARPHSTVTNNSVHDLIVRILRRFDLVARQLRTRREKRSTITINDEYDVQDLLHALLKIHIDDVRPEEYTPSYGGGNSRMDFLLKSEQIVVEAKMIRSGLGDKELGGQLLIDIGRYQTHPDCKTLICFIYDPDRLLRNPEGLERDLTKKQNEMSVVAIVNPKE